MHIMQMARCPYLKSPPLLQVRPPALQMLMMFPPSHCLQHLQPNWRSATFIITSSLFHPMKMLQTLQPLSKASPLRLKPIQLGNYITSLKSIGMTIALPHHRKSRVSLWTVSCFDLWQTHCQSRQCYHIKPKGQWSSWWEIGLIVPWYR